MGTEKTLPYPSAYPFDWTVSPLYEIIFTVQVVCDVLIPIIVLGCDFLFFSLCFTLTAQYIGLHHVIRKLGSKDMRNIIEKVGFDQSEIPQNQEDVAKMFIEIFAKQHVMLVRSVFFRI